MSDDVWGGRISTDVRNGSTIRKGMSTGHNRNEIITHARTRYFWDGKS